MPAFKTNDTCLEISFNSTEQIFSFTPRVVVPYQDILDIFPVKDSLKEEGSKEPFLKVPGTHVWGLFKAGYFKSRYSNFSYFMYARRGVKGIVIYLSNNNPKMSKIVVQCDSPEDLVERVLQKKAALTLPPFIESQKRNQ